MAPPPGIVEVRCAGCGETLEVEPGLTEFACPDCGTHQALPPELMPRRPRRALPIPGRRAPLAAPSRIACGECSAVISVPHGQGRFACPLCGAELDAPPVAAISVVVPPAAVPITPSRSAQPSEDLDNGGKLGVDIDSSTNILRESVDQRAYQTEDTRDQANREAQIIRLGSHSVQRQAGSGKQGRSCDAISVSKKAQCEPLSKSSPVCVSKQGQQPMFTKEQVQGMITQALQGLNEAWEKKFLSLEQKMPSISSSHIAPNGVKESSLAVRRSKRCKLARQDTLDSMDGEDSDAEDDSDYQA